MAFIDRNKPNVTWINRLYAIANYIKDRGVFVQWKFGSAGVKFGSANYTFGGSKIETDTNYSDRDKPNTNWTNT